jgi:hypothetical protein
LCAKEAIVAPAKGSKHATAAALRVAKDKEDNKEVKSFNAYLIDNYDSIN